jgi:positive regulator of sigma E activity
MDHVVSLEHPPTRGEIVAGSLLALLVPLIGFAVGAMWLDRGARSMAHGVGALGLACACLAFWIAFTF